MRATIGSGFEFGFRRACVLEMLTLRKQSSRDLKCPKQVVCSSEENKTVVKGSIA